MPLTLLHIAPTTASRSPSPARAGEAFRLRHAGFSPPMRGTQAAAKHRRSEKGYGILASPADAGERSTSANHTSFYSCSWDVFPYDLFPVQLCPMGLLLGQVSKWRVQRADGGAHAARSFVGGATKFLHSALSMRPLCWLNRKIYANLIGLILSVLSSNNGLQNRAVSSKILLMK